MPIHRSAWPLLLVLACETTPAARATKTSATAGAPANAKATDAKAPTAAAPPVDPAVTARAQAAAERFAGGKRCDVAALAELRAMRSEHGASAIRDALVTAFTACDEPSAIADLLLETTPADAPLAARLPVGAALIRAARYAEAAEMLVPLVATAGQGSKTEWLAGFALFHAGRSTEALPMLERARAEASPGVPDPYVLIGLCRLYEGDTDGAVRELEAGRAAFPDHPTVANALARAYAQAGRAADAEAMRAAAVAANAAVGARESTMAQLSAMSVDVNMAIADSRFRDADAMIEKMLPMAPDDVRQNLLATRAMLAPKLAATSDAAKPNPTESVP